MAVRFQDARVSVVGLGLMGGSLAAALTARGACRQVTGVARREETVTQALGMGIVHQGSTDLREGVTGADVVVLATPVRTIISQIEELGPLVNSGCLVTDVGSTKRAILEAMTRLPPGVQAVGGHPMCGREVAGLEASDSELYDGATYVFTPLERTGDSALDLACEMARAIGAQPLVLDADRHDLLAAAVSHLPYLVSAGLVGAVETLEDEAAWEMASSGFRDASRLAASDETMMIDILLTNRMAVRRMLSSLVEALTETGRLIETGDVAGLNAAISAAAQRRRSLDR